MKSAYACRRAKDLRCGARKAPEALCVAFVLRKKNLISPLAVKPVFTKKIVASFNDADP